MNHGFLPGDTTEERVSLLMSQRHLVQEMIPKINDFLGKAVAVVREHFHGKITYAAVPLERIEYDDLRPVRLGGGYERDEAGQAERPARPARRPRPGRLRHSQGA